ncbi:RNA-dependent RNA polymerase 1 [Hordeum vulgare]|nr:RNA-dependent RNA polymerase 1 [Hordeum vulgare]
MPRNNKKDDVLDDEEWEVRFHLLDRDNLERTICLSDITYWNLIALIEIAGCSSRDFMYYVRDPGVGVSGMEELTDYDKVEEMFDDITSKGNSVVNIRVMRSDAPTTADLNIGHLYEERVPLFEFGVPLVYESTLDYGSERYEYFMETDQEQEKIEQMMEQKRNEEIKKFRTNQKQKEKYKVEKRKLPQMLAEELTDNDSENEILAHDDIIARLEAMKMHRVDPLNHYDKDTDVEELYEPDDEEGE